MKYSLLKVMAISAVTLMSTIAFAEDAQEPTFPGKFGLEFKQTMQAASTGNRVQDTEKSDAAILSKTEFKAKIDFSLANGLYTVSPWAKERLDMFYDPVYATTTSVNAMGKFNARNRFDLGIDNTITLKDIIKIGLNPAFRFEHKLNANIQDNENTDADEKYGAAVKFAFMPSLVLGYSYNMGFAWNFLTTLYVNTYPIMDQVDNNSILYSLEVEGTYDLSFDILKAMKVKNYSFAVFGQEYFDMPLYTENYKIKIETDDIDGSFDDNYDGKTISGEISNEAKLGISAAIFDLGLRANYYCKAKTYIDDIDDNGWDFWNGIQVASTFKKSNWEIGVEYTGMILTWLGKATYNDDGDKFVSRAVEDNDQKYWENTIEAYFKVKM